MAGYSKQQCHAQTASQATNAKSIIIIARAMC